MMRAVIPVIIAALLILTAGCARRVVYMPSESVRHTTDTLRVTALRVDSVWVRDSVAVTFRGDTVEKTVWRERVSYRARTDTVWRVAEVLDSVAVPYPVERRLTGWEQAKMDAGGVAIGIIGLIIITIVAYLIFIWRKR